MLMILNPSVFSLDMYFQREMLMGEGWTMFGKAHCHRSLANLYMYITHSIYTSDGFVLK